MWWSYSDSYLNGIRDPARHTVEALQEFVDSHSVPNGGTSVGPPAKRQRNEFQPSGGARKDELVARVKNFQRADTNQKEMWWSYSDSYLNGVRDPARHTVEALQEFVDSHSVPNGGTSVGPPAKRQRNEFQPS